MARKSKAELAALFANNTTGEISPTDLRDFLDTMNPAYGGLFFSTPAATSCPVAGTDYKAAGTTTLTHVNDFTHSNNRLTYVGTPAVHVHIAASMSYTTSGSNDIIRVTIAKNGVAQNGSETRSLVGTGSSIESTASHFDMMLSTNDYIELFVANETIGATDVTLQNGYMFAMSMMV